MIIGEVESHDASMFTLDPRRDIASLAIFRPAPRFPLQQNRAAALMTLTRSSEPDGRSSPPVDFRASRLSMK